MADRPKTFAEIAAAADPAERERWRRAQTFDDSGFVGDIRQVTVIEHQFRNGEWLVEYFDADGAPYLAVFRRT
jgi:hypothetical protein